MANIARKAYLKAARKVSYDPIKRQGLGGKARTASMYRTMGTASKARLKTAVGTLAKKRFR